MILKERGRPLVRNRRRDKNGSVCLARPVRVVDMLVRCIRRHSTRDEKITATLLPSTLRQPRRGSRPSNLALQTRVSGAESLARGPCRRRPRSAILFRSRARGCSEGISWQALRWSLVSWSWIWVSARRHNGAVALAEMFSPLGVPAFSFARGGRQLTRGHGGEREDGVEARSRAAVRARGRRGKDPKAHERSDVGVSTPRFPQALNSPVPPVWTSWGGRLLSRPIDSGPNANNATSLADFFPFRRRHHSWKLELRRDKIAMLSRNHLYGTSQVPKLAEANISHGSYPHLEVCRVALSIEAAQHM